MYYLGGSCVDDFGGGGCIVVGCGLFFIEDGVFVYC